MACERFQNWLTDAALGELPAEQRAALETHFRGCQVCREEFAQAQAITAALNRSFSALASAEPSPAMLSRLRRRIASQPHEILAWWRIAAAVLPLLVLAAVWLARFVPLHHVQESPQVSSVAEGRNLVPETKPSESQRNDVRSESTFYPTWPSSRNSASRVVHASRQPEIIVPRGQWAQLVTLRKEVQEGRVITSSLRTSADDADRLLTIESLDVTPLTFPPVVSPEGSGDGSKNL